MLHCPHPIPNNVATCHSSQESSPCFFRWFITLVPKLNCASKRFQNMNQDPGNLAVGMQPFWLRPSSCPLGKPDNHLKPCGVSKIINISYWAWLAGPHWKCPLFNAWNISISWESTGVLQLTWAIFVCKIQIFPLPWCAVLCLGPTLPTRDCLSPCIAPNKVNLFCVPLDLSASLVSWPLLPLVAGFLALGFPETLVKIFWSPIPNLSYHL